MGEQKQFITVCNMRLKNMSWHARKRISTTEGILNEYKWFLGYVKAMRDVGVIDEGRVTAAVTATQRAEKKPDGTYTSNRHRDIYTNWFGSRKEALAYVEECKQA